MFAVHLIDQSAPGGPSDRLARTIDALCREVAAYAVRDRAFQVLVLLLWNRLQRVKRRFAVLAQQVQAGTLRAPLRHPRPAAAQRLPPAVPLAPPVVRLPVLPRRFGWVARWVPGTASFGSQLQALLNDPEMQALLRAAPQAARLLRPLAHMLAVRPLPEVLRPAPRPAQPPKPPRPPTPSNPSRSRSPRIRIKARAVRGIVLDLSGKDAWDRLLAHRPPPGPPPDLPSVPVFQNRCRKSA